MSVVRAVTIGVHPIPTHHQRGLKSDHIDVLPDAQPEPKQLAYCHAGQSEPSLNAGQQSHGSRLHKKQ